MIKYKSKNIAHKYQESMGSSDDRLTNYQFGRVKTYR